MITPGYYCSTRLEYRLEYSVHTKGLGGERTVNPVVLMDCNHRVFAASNTQPRPPLTGCGRPTFRDRKKSSRTEHTAVLPPFEEVRRQPEGICWGTVRCDLVRLEKQVREGKASQRAPPVFYYASKEGC